MKKILLLAAVCCMALACEKEPQKELDGARFVANVSDVYICMEFTSVGVKFYSVDRNYLRNSDAFGGYSGFTIDESLPEKALSWKMDLDNPITLSVKRNYGYRDYEIKRVYVYKEMDKARCESDPTITREFMRIN